MLPSQQHASQIAHLSLAQPIDVKQRWEGDMRVQQCPHPEAEISMLGLSPCAIVAAESRASKHTSVQPPIFMLTAADQL